jgi:hypothetical protein
MRFFSPDDLRRPLSCFRRLRGRCETIRDNNSQYRRAKVSVSHFDYAGPPTTTSTSRTTILRKRQIKSGLYLRELANSGCSSWQSHSRKVSAALDAHPLLSDWPPLPAQLMRFRSRTIRVTIFTGPLRYLTSAGRLLNLKFV